LNNININKSKLIKSERRDNYFYVIIYITTFNDDNLCCWIFFVISIQKVYCCYELACLKYKRWNYYLVFHVFQPFRIHSVFKIFKYLTRMRNWTKNNQIWSKVSWSVQHPRFLTIIQSKLQLRCMDHHSLEIFAKNWRYLTQTNRTPVLESRSVYEKSRFCRKVPSLHNVVVKTSSFTWFRQTHE